MSDLSLFKGYEETPSSRYQTKRADEIKMKNESLLDQFIMLKDLLENPIGIPEETLEIYEKRFRTLKKMFKVNKKEVKELMIPFDVYYEEKAGSSKKKIGIKNKMTVYVPESKIYSEKNLKRFSKKKITERYELYLKILPNKPANTVYWNPF